MAIPISFVTVNWTVVNSVAIKAAEIRSRIVGTTAWTEQAANADPASGTFTFEANAPNSDIEVQLRYRMVNGSVSQWVDMVTHTSSAVVQYATVAGTPTSLSQVNSTEGSKLGGIQPGATVGARVGTNVINSDGTAITALQNGADVTAQNTAKDTSAVNGIPAATITSNLANVSGTVFDTTAPDVPTGLALSSSIAVDQSGNQVVTVKASWSASTASDTAGYILSLSTNGGGFVDNDCGNVTSYSFTTIAGTAVSAKIAAYDRNANKSGYSAVVSYTASKDTTPPGLATNLTATTLGIGGLTISWTNPSDSDLASAIVYEGTTNDSSKALLVSTVVAKPNSISSATLTRTTGSTFYYWVKTQDTSGNLSGFSASASGTVASVTNANLPSGLQIPGIVGTLPSATNYTGPASVLNLADGKVYRYISGSWITGVTGTDISLGTIPNTAFAQTNLASLSPTATLDTSLVKINSAGQLTGAGGGQVTISGLGYTGALNAGSVIPAITDTNGLYKMSGNTVTKTGVTGWNGSFFIPSPLIGACRIQCRPTVSAAGFSPVTSFNFGLSALPTYGQTSGFGGSSIYGIGVSTDQSQNFYIVNSSGIQSSTSISYTAGDVLTVDYAGSVFTYYRTTLAGVTTIIGTTNGTLATPFYAVFKGYAVNDSFRDIFLQNQNDSSWGSITGSAKPADNATVGAPAGTMVGSTLAQTIETRANDPATQVNAGTTTISGGKITTGSIQAGQIAAGAITTSKLLITNSGSALNADPNCADATAWQLVSGSLAIFAAVTDGQTGTTVMRSAGAGTQTWMNGADRIAVDPTKTYRMRCYVRQTSGSGSGLYAGVALFDASGANIGGDGSQWDYGAAAGVAVPSSWTLYQTTFGANTARTIPTNGRTMSPLVILSYGGGSSVMEAQDIRIEEVLGSTLIQDGAILTSKLAAGSVTANILAANSVTANAIAAGSVQTVALAAGSVTANAIAANAVTANSILAGAVQAAALAANSVTANALAANSVTSNSIAANSISAGMIQGGVITGDKFNTATSLPGAITIDKTGVSIATVSAATTAATPGANRCFLSEFEAGGTGWDVIYNPQGIFNGGRDVGNSSIGIKYYNFGYTATASGQVFSVGTAIDYNNYYFSVVPGETLAVQVAAGGNGPIASQALAIFYYDGSNNQCGGGTIATTTSFNFPTQFGGFSTVPSGAAKARIELYLYTNGSGSGVHTLARPMVSQATPGQTALPTFVPGPVPKIAAASVINANSTTINPGNILISGGTTLANWRAGGDNTQINGGAIYANSITANKLTIGARGITVQDCQFQCNPANNTITWGSGYVSYIDDNGNTAGVGINAGSAQQNNNYLYIYWVKGASSLTVSTGIVTGDNIVFAIYTGGAGLLTYYGRTIIDGANITTGSITANQIAANSITGNQIAAGTITAQKIAAASITGNQIAAGSVNASAITAQTITTDRLVNKSVTQSFVLISNNSFNGDGYTAASGTSANGGGASGGGSSDGSTGGGSGSGGSYCPEIITPVLMSDGSWKLAGDLKVGDLVLTQHELTLEWGDYRVTRARKFEALLWYADGFFRATEHHPFYLGGEWVEMIDIGAPSGLGFAVSIEIEDAHTFVTQRLDGSTVLNHNKVEQ